MKQLESRSQLLETALASADEANRRWEECRALVDQLRVENAAIRAENASLRQALVNARIISPTAIASPNGTTPLGGVSLPANGTAGEGAAADGNQGAKEETDGKTSGGGVNETTEQS
jgi:hypothetical protein